MTPSELVTPVVPDDLAAAVAAVSTSLSVRYNPVGFDFAIAKAWSKDDQRHAAVRRGELGDFKFDIVDHFGADWNYPNPDARQEALARLVSRLQRFAPKGEA